MSQGERGGSGRPGIPGFLTGPGDENVAAIPGPPGPKGTKVTFKLRSQLDIVLYIGTYQSREVFAVVHRITYACACFGVTYTAALHLSITSSTAKLSKN